jgi:RNA polymerase sigma-70 factor (ECF subfamily)
VPDFEDLFRRESAHLVAALARLLGPARLALAEDVVQEALIAAMQAWRFGVPDRPAAWLLQVAKRRAIDVLRRDQRLAGVPPEPAVDLALSPEADGENQLAMMFAICDPALAPETHVTLILRLLCGLASAEIARAFFVDVPTIDRRLHRGRARLQALGALPDVRDAAELRARQPSVEHALYLMFNEGYHGGDADAPLHPALCADALRLVELLLGADGIARERVHALAALCCFTAARLATRLDGDALVPLAAQDRTRWDRALIERGIAHLGGSAAGGWTRWHLEAAIAYEHVAAPSLAATRWDQVIGYYDLLVALVPGPIVALGRALAIAERDGPTAGRAALAPLADDPRLARSSLLQAARAELARRAGDLAEAHARFVAAAELATSHAERRSYERQLRACTMPGCEG